MIGNSTSNMRA
ncbi:hypothetical protein LINPERHAP1_LOCUS13172 [Linum perenne]